MKINHGFFIILIAVVLHSCKTDDTYLNKQILGYWDVYGSEINNKPNDFMKNAWFHFESNNNVTSNLFENEQSRIFDISNGKLNINTKDNFSMEIAKLENDTMFLEGKLKYYYMEYFLVKRKS